MKNIFPVFLIFLFSQAFGQEAIFLNNPSFESIPRGGSTPTGWYDCGFPGETPPDTHPSGAFEVTKLPQHGSTYLGMVTRGNNTWEMVSQMLESPLEAGQCYDFQIYLARSARYWSLSNWSQGYDNYTDPIVLRIWGGNSKCDKKENLYESGAVENTDWKAHKIKLNPRRNLRYIVFEVYYKVPTLFEYNGNILMDNCSAIVPCGEEFPEEPEPPEELIAENKVNVKPKDPPRPVETPKEPEVKPTPEPPVVAKPEIKPDVTYIPELDNKTIAEGQIIRIDSLFFAADTSNIKEHNFPVLDEIYEFLDENPRVSIEIGGHTNGLPPHTYCDRLSQARAKSVVDYLIEKGIDPRRMTAKGYGKRKPVESNRTLEGRKKNQRVEMTIVSVSG